MEKDFYSLIKERFFSLKSTDQNNEIQYDQIEQNVANEVSIEEIGNETYTLAIEDGGAEIKFDED